MQNFLAQVKGAISCWDFFLSILSKLFDNVYFTHLHIYTYMFIIFLINMEKEWVYELVKINF